MDFRSLPIVFKSLTLTILLTVLILLVRKVKIPQSFTSTFHAICFIGVEGYYHHRRGTKIDQEYPLLVDAWQELAN